MKYTVYIIRTDRNTLYTGITNDLEKRLAEHMGKSKRSAKYLRGFGKLELVHTEIVADKSEALKREIEIKQMSKAEKEALVTD